MKNDNINQCILKPGVLETLERKERPSANEEYGNTNRGEVLNGAEIAGKTNQEKCIIQVLVCEV